MDANKFDQTGRCAFRGSVDSVVTYAGRMDHLRPPGDDFRSDHAATAGAVVRHNFLPREFTQPAADQARRVVVAATWVDWHPQADEPGYG